MQNPLYLLSDLEKKKKKTEKDVLIVNDFGTPHLASPISKTSGFQKIRFTNNMQIYR